MFFKSKRKLFMCRDHVRRVIVTNGHYAPYHFAIPPHCVTQSGFITFCALIAGVSLAMV